jgi:formylglycine-generating enzyme required for sulfatase activity
MPHIFISYAKQDTFDLAVLIRDRLGAVPGITVWLDDKLEPAESWALQIQQEIDRCDCVVVLLSPDVNRPIGPKQRRSFVLNEIDYAQQEHKTIIPVMAQATRVPVQLAGVQYIDLSQNQSSGLEKLVQTVRKMGDITNAAAPIQAAPLAYQPIPAPVTGRFKPMWILGPIILVIGVLALSLLRGNFNLSGSPPASTLTSTSPATATPAVTAVLTSATPMPSAFPTLQLVLSDNEWTPLGQSVDDVEMVLVPSGCFMMGGNRFDEAQHRQCLETFAIDRYEVTNAQFEAFGGQAAREGSSTNPNHPRDNITWFEARDFCLLRGAGLPTEAEWEYAARGPESLLYPWGNAYVPTNIVEVIDAGDPAANVGSSMSDMSWVGAFDMVGNIHEWTNSIFTTYPYSASDGRENYTNVTDLRVIRGIRSTNSRVSYTPTGQDARLGFRCAFSTNLPPIDLVAFDVEAMKLERMTANRGVMFDELRDIIDNYNSTAKGIIDTLGR